MIAMQWQSKSQWQWDYYYIVITIFAIVLLLLQYNDSAIVSAIAVIFIVLKWQQGESNAIATTNNSYRRC